MLSDKTIPSAALAFVVPFVLHGMIVIILGGVLHGRTAIEHVVVNVSIVVSEVVGISFLVKPFRKYVVPIALGYFPAMYAALFMFGFLIVGQLFGDWL